MGVGVLISYEGKVTQFWYGCPTKRSAREIVETHCHHHPTEDRAKMRAEWVTKWVDDKPADPETISF